MGLGGVIRGLRGRSLLVGTATSGSPDVIDDLLADNAKVHPGAIDLMGEPGEPDLVELEVTPEEARRRTQESGSMHDLAAEPEVELEVPDVEEQEPPDSEEEFEDEDEEEEGDSNPVDLTTRPEGWNALQHTPEVPLQPFEVDELKRHCQAWKREEPESELPHQMLRAIHELEEDRQVKTAELMASGGMLQTQVAILQAENDRLKQELDQTKKLMAAQSKLQEALLSTAVDEKVLGARVEKLDVGDLFGMTALLPEERNGDE
jgi:hypothetical protein